MGGRFTIKTTSNLTTVTSFSSPPPHRQAVLFRLQRVPPSSKTHAISQRHSRYEGRHTQRKTFNSCRYFGKTQLFRHSSTGISRGAKTFHAISPTTRLIITFRSIHTPLSAPVGLRYTHPSPPKASAILQLPQVQRRVAHL